MGAVNHNFYPLALSLTIDTNERGSVKNPNPQTPSVPTVASESSTGLHLHHFIERNLDVILAEWDTFAKTLTPAATDMTVKSLRDHGKEILLTIAADIAAFQSSEKQREKSLGHASTLESENSAASIHGALRQGSDFSLLQLSAEYRALRASVLRLWLPCVSVMSSETVAQVTRFNEAIDQALAESIVTFSAEGDKMRDMFMAILGHDLRAPISTMTLAGDVLTRPQLTLERANQIGTRVKRSALVMSAMVDDLLGYTRTQLGSGMPVSLAHTDVREVCQGAVDDASAAHPETDFRFETQGDLSGGFDKVRLHQLFTNVLMNAAQYGEKGKPVLLKAERVADHLIVTTTNYGKVIPEAHWTEIFKPLVQLEDVEGEDSRPKTSLGLGLFVAKEITGAHGGTIGVTSDEDKGTVFTMKLPVRVGGAG